MRSEEITAVGHGFGPFIRPDSRILILGSFPSVKSREQQFFYGHPRNRFWPLLAELLKEPLPELEDIPGKKALLEKHHIALYDSIERCDIRGSADAQIRNAVAADIPSLLQQSEIRAIFCNGALSYNSLCRFYPDLPVKVCRLPSTSPANAAMSLEKLEEAWGVAFRKEFGV